ncbi:XdhA Xanthine dehydrogenase, iron-sulfur cluster and FAD-binding subunit A [Rhabdaerophilaceae bacterium]
MRHSIRFLFRGCVVALDAFDPTRTLLEWLREDNRATGTKEGCNEGDCGACTVVLVDLEAGQLRYRPVNSCIMLLGMVDGCEILTIEDLARDGLLHPIQNAMIATHGSQCGFCTPGIVMSLFAAYHTEERPLTRARFDAILAGNLCRCTGYRPIADAAFAAFGEAPDDAFTASQVERAVKIADLQNHRDVMVRHGTGFFAAPASLEGLANLAVRHPEATLLAGGTDVGLWVTKRLADLREIIWLGRVAELERIENLEQSLHLGAMVNHARAAPFLAGIDPDLGVLMQRFGSMQVRASGTVGGNIANGSPIGDLAPALIALGTMVHLRKGGLSRTLPLEQFFLAYGKQAREPGEVLVGLTIQKPRPGTAFRAFKISKRFDEDISAVMGAFCIAIADGRIAEARIAFGGMAGTPARARATEAALIGLQPEDQPAYAIAEHALDADFSPISDMRASADYRRRVARSLLAKALLEISGTPANTRIIPREKSNDAI